MPKWKESIEIRRWQAYCGFLQTFAIAWRLWQCVGLAFPSHDTRKTINQWLNNLSKIRLEIQFTSVSCCQNSNTNLLHWKLSASNWTAILSAVIVYIKFWRLESIETVFPVLLSTSNGIACNLMFPNEVDAMHVDVEWMRKIHFVATWRFDDVRKWMKFSKPCHRWCYWSLCSARTHTHTRKTWFPRRKSDKTY